MVCQRLALIMGFVSVCLRKWHARVYRCVCVCALVRVAVCLRVRQSEHGCGKNVYAYGRLYFQEG